MTKHRLIKELISQTERFRNLAGWGALKGMKSSSDWAQDSHCPVEEDIHM